MSRASAKYSQWKIFLDGVEVPWLSFTLGMGLDFAGQMTIVLEPDARLYDIRPKTVVNLFFYDSFETGTGADDRKKLKHFWEGTVEGISISKVAQGRAFTLNATGMLNALESKMFAHGFGQIPVTPLVSGSLFAYTESLTQDQLFSFAMFGKNFDPYLERLAESAASLPYVGARAEAALRSAASSESIAYSRRILQLLAYLSSYNALARMMVVRSRIFSKINYLADETLGKLIPRNLASKYMKEANGLIGESTTLLELANIFNGLAFHSIAAIPGAVMDKEEKPDPIYFPGLDPTDQMYAIGRQRIRNDYLFVPQLYYAVPPACNWIFPDFIQTLDLQRAFGMEPTRALIVDTYGGGSLQIAAPDEILRYRKGTPDPTQFWGINVDGIKQYGEVKSPYHSKAAKGQSGYYNLFGTITDYELEKGIIVKGEYAPFEFFSAVANTFDIRTREGRDSFGAANKPIAQLLQEIQSGDSKSAPAYVYMMKALADYTLNLERFRRTVSIDLVGHRWIVPGFPCVIFDTMRSYIAFVRSVMFTVDAEGRETTQVGLDFTRPFPKTSAQTVAAFASITDTMNKIGSMNAKLEAFNKSVDEDVEKIRGEVSQMRLVAAVSPDAFDLFKTKFLSVYNASIRSQSALTDMGTNKGEMESLRAFFQQETGEAHTPEWAVSETSLSNMNKAATIIIANANLRKQQAELAAKSFDSSKTPQPETDKDVPAEPSRALRSAISAVAKSKSIFPEDFFAPPVFGNFDMIDPTKAEKKYADLIGSRPILTELGAESSQTGAVSGFNTPTGDATRVTELRIQSYSQFVNLTRTLGKVFPVTGDPTGTSEWETRRADESDMEPMRDWIERRFLRRTGLQDLDQFAAANGLNIRMQSSNPPVQINFMVLEPKDTFLLPSGIDGVTLTWDDTIYSKVVDEFRIVRRKVTTKTEAATRTLEPDYDPEIEELRKSVKIPELTAKVRQEFWIAYSKDHFGSRAFSER